jgi:hypothetical protein
LTGGVDRDALAGSETRLTIRSSVHTVSTTRIRDPAASGQRPGPTEAE